MSLRPSRFLLLFFALVVMACAVLALAADGPLGVERVARMAPLGYAAPRQAKDDTTLWLQVDLGAVYAIDSVKLLPQPVWDSGNGGAYPRRFKIEASDSADLADPKLIVDRTGADVAQPGDVVGVFPAGGVKGRYVRLTVTKLRDRQLALSKLEVWSGGRDVAEGARLNDSLSAAWRVTPLTRHPRPNGEEDVTDNPANVIPAEQWKPVAYAAHKPLGGVKLGDGPLKTAMENNVAYLLSSFTDDELLRDFRARAGKPNPTGMKRPDGFWDTALAGSNAGRFLMGAGNTLRWMDSPALRARMNHIVDVIDECKDPDGYCMAYAPGTIFYNERAAYTRAWVTRGLVDAGFGGNAKAFALLRGYYDWFDTNPYLPELLRRGGQGVQGMIANTETYFTPIGKPADLQVIQRYFQENYWLDQLAARDPAAIWRYPYDHPHCYLITSLEPYLDLYRATGAEKYLAATQGGWDIYHEQFEHLGGAISICEGQVYEPKSNYLHRGNGELCGNVFWTRYSQRFHLLFPDQEKYVAEIEKSIYNVGLANQVGGKSIRYLANLEGRKQPGTAINTCCEGQGTRLFGALPEYLYSLAADGLYLDLFAASTITWQQGGRTFQGDRTFRADTATQFPFAGDVRVTLSVDRPTPAKIRVRVPSWIGAEAEMPIFVNHERAAVGQPGSYAVLDRTWREGDVIEFTLPMALRLTPYVGRDQIRGGRREALEFGPILMAFVGSGNRLALTPEELLAKLHPKPGEPLHYTIDGDPGYEVMPYWQVAEQEFTCFPALGYSAAGLEKPGPHDLALASKGASATSDSEYAQEPGGTAKVIDGIIATPDDFSNRWHSSLDTPHPHWIQVKLAKPETIGRIVVRFADPAGHPVSFQGIVWVDGKEKVLFDETDYADDRQYGKDFAPLVTDTFRFLIRSSASATWLNAAQVSEIEIYPPGG